MKASLFKNPGIQTLQRIPSDSSVEGSFMPPIVAANKALPDNHDLETKIEVSPERERSMEGSGSSVSSLKLLALDAQSDAGPGKRPNKTQLNRKNSDNNSFH